MCPKKKVTQLGIGKEDNKEHNGKAQDVLGTTSQRGGQLSHCFVKANILEYLQEKKNRDKVRTNHQQSQSLFFACMLTKAPRRQSGWGNSGLEFRTFAPDMLPLSYEVINI